MANYLVNHEKKLRIFAKREQELVHAIKHSASEIKLFLAAEKVREAKIAVFKCKFAQQKLHEPHKFDIEELVEKKKDVAIWVNMTTEEIVERYAKTIPSLE